jgi:hypothetical protein
MINKDEPKVLRLYTLREIPAARLKSNLKSTFEKNLPSGDTSALKKKIDTFLGFMTHDLKKGVTVDIVYIPGKGTSLTENSAAIGSVIPGTDFSQLVWRSYFGEKAASKNVKESILKQCKGQ